MDMKKAQEKYEVSEDKHVGLQDQPDFKTPDPYEHLDNATNKEDK